MILALFVSITLFVPLLAPLPHRIDAEHFCLIGKGMIEGDVEAIFGVSAGYYDYAVIDGSPTGVFWVEDAIAMHPVGSIGARMWVSRHGAFTSFLARRGQ
jgi:hypothetical protein